LADVILERKPVAGAVVASEGAVTVVLDTTVTPDLVAEGHAREFISLLQQARKDTGLAVSDRISVTWDTADTGLAAAIATWAPAIASEVLATAFTRAPGGTESDLNGVRIGFTLTRA
jgi:isoleucyl-tRNA synthetase